MSKIKCPLCGKTEILFRSDSITSYEVNEKGVIQTDDPENALMDKDKWVECFACDKTSETSPELKELLANLNENEIEIESNTYLMDYQEHYIDELDDIVKGWRKDMNKNKCADNKDSFRESLKNQLTEITEALYFDESRDAGNKNPIY